MTFERGKGGVGIIGVGASYPDKVLTSEAVEAGTGLASGYIKEKTGIEERRVVVPGETASALSVAAARQALEHAGLGADALDLIVAATFTADYKMPALAAKVHAMLGAKRAGAFDVMANCTAFQVGLTVASDRMMADPTVSHSLVLGTAIVSRFLDFTDPSSSIYFGDGAGAAVVGRVPEGYGFLAHDIMTVSGAYEAVRLRGGGSTHPHEPGQEAFSPYIEMSGMDVWKQAAQHQPVIIKRVLEKAGLSLADVDFFVFHQANLHLIQYLVGKMKQSMDKTHMNVQRLGNTAEASMAIALQEAVALGKIKHGDIVVISGVGAGFTFGASVMRWFDDTGRLATGRVSG